MMPSLYYFGLPTFFWEGEKKFLVLQAILFRHILALKFHLWDN